jgi:hypothetical protein
MIDSSPSPSPTPKAPSALWKWTKRVGCTLTLLSLTCCFVTCGGFWWTQDALRNMHKEEADRIHAEGLRGGDLEMMHAHADREFRKRYSVEDLRKLLQDHPGLFDRENFFGMEFERRIIDGVEYVKIKSKRGWLTLQQAEIVFKVVDGELQLVGISPGMDDLVPHPFRMRIGGGGWD